MAVKVVGLGPGDPKLLTLAAAEALREAEVVYVPASAATERSLAEALVRRFTEAEVRVVEMEMGRADPVRLARSARELGDGAVYALLGDPTLYGSFAKLKPYLEAPYVYIPGVTSVTACAARAGVELASGDQAVAVVPASRSDLLEKAAELFDVVVVVKANRNVDLVNELAAGRRALAARRCYMEGEQISERVSWLDYFTTVYIWRGR
ncbi:cobalt-factor II C(20)-methyltransferase [Pyrobaculum neutrophilum]|uniref:Uroporphyrin-III C/tetrapyrrole (Corrin/Porphyrin) methyltransferase n=1 Tax=Pyrobaculum neutrophilum (strain DSM 2338 / JCM 9278 / NBRC 100436 / V24Sta) TaxID=444157 RepID=B1YBC0_PYRNV|nr:cobalt-factor II C(20)-methyltransferase [Pyrobaculum neutrophilum]ACB39251.1 Uroporphyrin-III C/tetrapyrrole (Corrin/Porphyrin) methyltransferase [Pyrobaculum neutrophilum V24Sta]